MTLGMEEVRSLPAEEKRRLLARLLEERRARQASREAPFGLLADEDRERVPEGAEDAYPVSALQAGMLFESELASGAAVYRDLQSVELVGPFRLRALRKALAETVGRHAVLRTGFDLSRFSEPVQIVHREVAPRLMVTDLRRLPEAQLELAVARWLAEVRRCPLPLAGPSLARFHVHRLEELRFRFSLELHHAILDGWSIASLLRELLDRYRRRVEGLPVPDTDPPPASFRRFVHLEREITQSEKAVERWREILEESPWTALPRWREGERESGGAGGTVKAVPLPEDVAEGAVALSRRLGVPVKSVALAAHLEVLAVVSGDDDVLTGLVTHGREDRRGGDEVLGLFVNTLPFRLPIDRQGGIGVESREALVRAAFEREAELLELRRFPLREIRRLHGGGPLFEVVFNFLTFHVFRGLRRVGPFEVTGHQGLEETDFPLTVNAHLEPTTGRLAVSLSCTDRTLRGAALEALAARYGRAFRALAEEPEGRPGAGGLMSRAERAQALWEWGTTGHRWRCGALLPELVRRRAESAPDAVSVCFEGRRITAGELRARVVRLAARLRAIGVASDVRVGIWAERSPELLVAILSVLEAGGAYVPLDPGQPAPRLRILAADAGLELVLAADGLPEPPVDPECRRLPIDGGPDAAPRSDDRAEPLPTPSSEDLAYVLYTSGSTGTPKGVMISHRALLSYLDWAFDAYPMGEGRGTPVQSPVGFDLTVTSLFLPLLAGSPVILLPDADPATQLPSLIRARGDFDLLKLTPAHLDLIGQALDDEEKLGAALCLVMGGEALHSETLQAWRRHAPSTRLVNEYGPTETVVGCTVHEVVPGDPWTGPVSIGRPFGEVRVHVVDRAGDPVPPGTPGELRIGGPSLARGYLGRPGATAERFVPDPFATRERAGERLYRSGDRVRFDAAGRLVFLGRIDTQIKVRGVRIEPAEIERVLESHPAVERAVVVLRDRRLAGYLVPENGERPDLAALRAYVRERLPEAMVPAVLVPLDAIPLTANGKVDVRALPAPAAEREDLDGAEYVAPRGQAERVLAEVWAEVLSVDRVGARDDFFRLGGDSILSLVARTKAEERGVRFELADLFRRPTIEALAAELSDRGPESEPPAPLSLLDPADRERLPPEAVDAYPLTRLQQGMLFHADAAGRSAYRNVASYRLRGPLDLGVLRQALERSVARHPVLRTTFDLAGYGVPLQIVHERLPAPLEVVDLSGLPESRREAVVRAWPARETRRGFPLESAPLFRLQAQLRGDGTFQLVLSFHHAILDGWSVAVFLTGLLRDYAALRGPGEPVGIEPAGEAFREYVELEGRARAVEESRDYWRRELEGAEETRLPRWPTLRSGSEDGDRGVGKVARDLPEELWRRVGRLARRLRVPVKTVHLAAYLKLISWLTGRDDVLGGVVVDGRPERRGSEDALGLFLNTLPLRLDVGRGSWRRLVLETFEAERSLLPHRRYPLADVRLPDGAAVGLDSMLNFTRFHVYRALADVEGFEVLDGLTASETNFPVVFNVSVDGAGTLVEMIHDRRAVPGAQAASLLARYQRVLERLCRHPEEGHAGWAPLSAAERHQALREWNATGRVYPGAPLLAHRVRERVAAHPEATAVVFGEEHLSYRELATRAGRLAAELRASGLRPEEPVGVCAERSTGLVVALLAVLEAGGSYVPLDPGYPEERLRFMVADAGLTRVVADRGQAPRVESWGARAVVLDPGAPEPGSDPSALAAPAPPPESVAYTIYTSGSTGRPKGAMNSHRAIVNRLDWMQEAYRLSDSDRVLQKTPFSFDVSVWELFWPLMTGAALVVARPEGHKDGSYLVDAIVRHRVTTLHFVPSMLSAFVETEGVAACAGSLRRVIASGEALPPALVGRFLGLLAPAVELHNLYGPTEAAVDVTSWPCGPAEAAGTVPIGRPIANLSTHVLDRWGEPSPVGSAGELLLGGIGLARGYLGRPGLTAERFVPSPFGPPGSRHYRTGDNARWLPNGALDFLGRLDFQVKLRGFRIELGEIEAALEEHPGVRDAVAVVRPVGASTEPRLLAYWTPRDGAAADTEALRSHLASRLPDHMVPAFFVPLGELPLTPNGKLDRRALPEPELDRSALDAPRYVAPRTDAERALAEVWREVLGVDRVGVEDDFFRLGGDSILSLRVAARAGRLGLRITSEELFRHPTVAGLAASTAGGAAGAEEEAPDAGEPRPSPDPEMERALRRLRAEDPDVEDVYPVTPVQRGMVFHGLASSGDGVYVGQWTWKIRGPLVTRDLRRAWRWVVDRHPVLRTSFRWKGFDEPVQVVHREVEPAWRELDWRRLDPDRRDGEMAELIAGDRRRGLPLDRPHLVPMTLIRLEDELYQMVNVHHHAILDGWSLPIVFDELLSAYNAFRRGEEPDRPPAPPYRRYVDRLAARDPEVERAFWIGRLEGTVRQPPIALGPPGPGPTDDGEVFSWHQRPLSEPATDRLTAWARRHGLTLSTVVHGAWALLLGRRTRRSELVIGSVVSGRPTDLEGAERMVGLFINTLPAAIRLPPDEPVVPWLRALQTELAALRRHEATPLADIRRWCGHAGESLFESIVVFENYPRRDSTEEDRAGLEVFDLRTYERTNYPLALVPIPGPRLVLTATADRRRFDPAAIERLLSHLEVALTSWARSEEASGGPGRLGDVPFLTPAERHQAVVEWGETREGRGPRTGRPATLMERFAVQVAARSDAPALVHEDRVLTYGELARRAGGLAGRLRRAGVGPDEPVGLWAERSVEAVVGILGILGAGAAYVPLDPEFPADRLNGMLADAGATRLVVPRDAASELPGCFEAAGGTLLSPEGSDGGELAGPLSDACAAYVMFTSGSTGRPKGVVVEHRQLASYLDGILARLDLPPGAAVAAVSTLAADLGHTGVFGSLATGGCLHLLSSERVASPADFAGYVAGRRVDAFKIVPSHLAALESGAPGVGPLPGLRLVLGGEVLSWKAARRVRERADAGCRVHNHYGPTEATVGVLSHRVFAAGPAFREPTVPIGRPLARVVVRLLDDAGHPAPVGVAAELCVGGASLARGYVGRPGATAERFVPAPSPAEPGSRLYRTGDLSRWLPDGTVEFLGRADRQVKVRGYRVETEEVAAALRSHPEVAAAVVTVHGEAGVSARLVGYVVGRDGASPDEAALRDHLGSRLPRHMIPSVLVALEALPLTPNGKVDTAALPAPGAAEAGAEEPEPPVTATERALAALWREVLGVGSVGRDSRFFDLGGDSLSSIRLLGRLGETLGVDLPARRFFEARDLAELAEAVDARRAGGDDAEERPVDLAAEAVLDPAIRPEGPAVEAVAAGRPEGVLLTGATGFVGVHLLHELLERTEARIDCLVREREGRGGPERLRAALEGHGLWSSRWEGRVRAVVGDLGRPRLGLSEAAFRELADGVDLVVHNGALVNFLYPYATHRAPNVQGTEEVLRLAAAGSRVQPVHFVSTVSVFESAERASSGPVTEADPPEEWRRLPNGYVESKWVAERLVAEAGRRGVPVAIHRVGRAGWHSRSGRWSEADMVRRMLLSSLRVGSAPEIDRAVPVVPVDRVAAALVALALARVPSGQVYHLTNPRPVPWLDLVERVVPGAGLRTEPLGIWWKEMVADLVASPGHPLEGFVDGGAAEAPGHNSDDSLLEPAQVEVACPRTEEALRELGVPPLGLDDEAVAALRRSLDPPASREPA